MNTLIIVALISTVLTSFGQGDAVRYLNGTTKSTPKFLENLTDPLQLKINFGSFVGEHDRNPHLLSRTQIGLVSADLNGKTNRDGRYIYLTFSECREQDGVLEEVKNLGNTNGGGIVKLHNGSGFKNLGEGPSYWLEDGHPAVFVQAFMVGKMYVRVHSYGFDRKEAYGVAKTVRAGYLDLGKNRFKDTLEAFFPENITVEEESADEVDLRLNEQFLALHEEFLKSEGDGRERLLQDIAQLGSPNSEEFLRAQASNVQVSPVRRAQCLSSLGRMVGEKDLDLAKRILNENLLVDDEDQSYLKLSALRFLKHYEEVNLAIKFFRELSIENDHELVRNEVPGYVPQLRAIKSTQEQHFLDKENNRLAKERDKEIEDKRARDRENGIFNTSKSIFGDRRGPVLGQD